MCTDCILKRAHSFVDVLVCVPVVYDRMRSMLSVLINLRRRDDKREQALKELAKVGFEPPYVLYATDGFALKAQNGTVRDEGAKWLRMSWNGRRGRQVRMLSGRHNRGTSWGTLGCLMSHERALKQHLQEEPLLVLEDDIVASPTASPMLLSQVMRYLHDKHPDWKLLLLGGNPRSNRAPRTRSAEVAPRLCPGLRYCEFAYESHAYIVRPAAKKELCTRLRAGSPSDSALIGVMRANIGKCFILDASVMMFNQDRKMKSDIRKSVKDNRRAAPKLRKRSVAYVTSLKAKPPQSRKNKSKFRRDWLIKIRRITKQMR